MAAQSFLAKNGMRTGLLGSAAALAIAFSATGDPDAGTDAARIGFYADDAAGSEVLGTVVGGVTGPTFTRNGSAVDTNLPGKVIIADTTASTGAGTGALQVSGGASFGAQSYSSADVLFENNVGLRWKDSVGTSRRMSLVSSSDTCFIGPIDAGWGAENNISAGTNVRFRVNGSSGAFTDAFVLEPTRAILTSSHFLLLQDTTASTGVGTGALQVTGGVGVAEESHFGDDVTVGSGAANLTRKLRVAGNDGTLTTLDLVSGGNILWSRGASTSLGLVIETSVGGGTGGSIDLRPLGTTRLSVSSIGAQIDGGLRFIERGAVPAAPIAGRGFLWVRNDAPNVLVFTDDAGTDTVLGGGGGGELLLSATGTDNLGTENLGSFAAIAAGAANNLAIGRDALAAVTTGDQHIGLGLNALSSVTTQFGVVGIGQNAGALFNGGDNGVFIGSGAGENINGGGSAGEEIVAVGYLAYRDAAGGRYHTAIGSGAMRYGRTSTVSGQSSIAIGRQALQGSSTHANNTGIDNICIGDLAGALISTGGSNIVVGNGALDNITNPSSCIVIGTDGLTAATGSATVAIGNQVAGNGTFNSCVLMGHQAADVGTGTHTLIGVTAVGYSAYGSGDESGSYHVALGYQAVLNGRTTTTTADHGIGIGYRALGGNSTATQNSGVSNLAIGASAGAVLSTGANNILLGNGSGVVLFGGSRNIAIGVDSFNTATNGLSTDNVIIGYQAGQTITSGTDNILLGNGAEPSAAGASNELVIGSNSNPTTIAYIGDGVTDAAPQTSFTLTTTGGSGTDIAASDLIIAGGRGTGTGAGGDIIFQTAPAGSTGSSLNALTTVATISELGVQIDRAVWTPTVALVDGANIATDASESTVFSVTLGGNRTLDNPTNLQDGATYIWVITQDGTGGHTLAYGSAFLWPGGAAPTLSAGAGEVDVISAVSDGTNLYASIQQDFS